MTALLHAIYAALPDLRPDQLNAVSTIVSGFYRENLDDRTRQLPPEDQNEFNFYRNTLECDSIVLPAGEARAAGLLSAMITERDYLGNFDQPTTPLVENYNDYEEDDLPPLVEDDELPSLPTLEELNAMREMVVPENIHFSINGQLVPPGVRVIDALNNDYSTNTRFTDALGLSEYNTELGDNDGWDEYNCDDDNDYLHDYLHDRTGECQGCIDGLENQQAHMDYGGCMFKPIRGIDYE
jgi:hypothetical protein